MWGVRETIDYEDVTVQAKNAGVFEHGASGFLGR